MTSYPPEDYCDNPYDETFQPLQTVDVDFSPFIKTIGKMKQVTTNDIRYEPMLFSCDLENARKLGGKITNDFIDQIQLSELYQNALLLENLNIVIDTRVTMTMPGMYPSIPGWHCDDFNRSIKYGQPDLENRDKRITHFMTIVSDSNDGVSCTEFITEPCTVSLNKNAVWNSLDKNLESEKFKHLKRKKLVQGDIINFNQDSIHRASKTTSNGWRWFGRLSFTYRKPANEIRTQVQVYASAENGW